MFLHRDFIYLKNQDRPNGNIYSRCKKYSTLKLPVSVTTKDLSTDIISLSKCLLINKYKNYKLC